MLARYDLDYIDLLKDNRFGELIILNNVPVSIQVEDLKHSSF